MFAEIVADHDWSSTPIYLEHSEGLSEMESLKRT